MLFFPKFLSRKLELQKLIFKIEILNSQKNLSKIISINSIKFLLSNEIIFTISSLKKVGFSLIKNCFFQINLLK